MRGEKKERMPKLNEKEEVPFSSAFPLIASIPILLLV